MAIWKNMPVMTGNSILRESRHIEWTIQNYFELPSEDSYSLESDYFQILDSKWFLSIWPNGDERDNTYGWIGLHLTRCKSQLEPTVTFKFGIKKNDGSDLVAVEHKHTFCATEGYEANKLIHRSQLLNVKDDVAKDGNLTIFCTFRMRDKPKAVSCYVDFRTPTHSDGMQALIEDLKNLYFSSQLSDVTIKVKDKEFRAHKSILSSRSSVFKSIFLQNVVEKNSECVEVLDCDSDTFEEFLLFLYTGECDNVSSSNAVSLYKTARKFDVKELKDVCVRCMFDELSNDLFFDFLDLATMYNEKDLQKAVDEFFIDNAKTIVITPKWQTFVNEHPVAGNKLFTKLLNSKTIL